MKIGDIFNEESKRIPVAAEHYRAQPLAGAVERDVNGILTRVFTVQHLAAICLQVGRPKDNDRVLRFVEAGALDAEIFEAILVRDDLMEKYRKFQQSYFNP